MEDRGDHVRNSHDRAGGGGGAAAAAPPAAAFIEIHNPASAEPPRRVALTPGTRRLVIGRAADADVRLDHAMVSRRHAELSPGPGGSWRLQDLGSHNGTLLNGAPLSDPVGCDLEPGDAIGVGPFVLTLAAEGTAVHLAGELPASPPPFPSRARTNVPVADTGPGRISTLGELEPPRVSADLLRTLSGLGRELLVTADPATRRMSLCRLMASPGFRGIWAAIVGMSRRDPDAAPQLLCEANAQPRHPHGGTPPVPHLSRSVLRAIRQKHEPVLATNVARAPGAWGLGDPGANIEVSIAPEVMPLAAVACPLGEPSEGPDAPSLELLYVLLPPHCGTAEWLSLASLAAEQYRQAEAAWAARRRAESHAALERELGRARDIQSRLVPRDPSVPGLDLAIGFSPCRWVAGDYVDVVPTAGGRTMLVVADVCGKGIAAAMIASTLHTMVHAAALAGTGPRELMTNLHRYLCTTLAGDSFATMVVVSLDVSTGEFECVNAGHPPPLLLDPAAVAAEASATRALQVGHNLPLGIDAADGPMELETGRLEPGQAIVLYTDGLTELRDGATGAMLGQAGLGRELLAALTVALNDSSAPSAARAAAERLECRLDAIRGPNAPEDDCTFLMARRV